MKRFLITVSCLLGLVLAAAACYYAGLIHIDFDAIDTPSVAVRTQGQTIQILTDSGWQDLQLRGVNLGSGLPGQWSTDYAIDEQTYLRWFDQIKAMGANVLRVYSIQNPAFYRALSSFNQASPSEPLYLLQGVWVNDYAQNSHIDAYDRSFYRQLVMDCRAAVDVVHGRRFILSNDAGGANGLFLTDVSRWVLGYVVGAEWTDVTVAYTDEKYPGMAGFTGDYLHTTPDASPFEIMLARTGDALIAYESERYSQQRLVTFANTRSTDPFDYPEDVRQFFHKCASIDAEHIRASQGFHAGLFASYSCYSYDLDYLSILDPSLWPDLVDAPVDFSDCFHTGYTTVTVAPTVTPDLTPTPTVTPIPTATPASTATPTPTVTSTPTVTPDSTVTPSSTVISTPTATPAPTTRTVEIITPNTYLAYLRLLNAHHSMPVVILEFGAGTGRGLAQTNSTTSLREGHFSEGEQGEAIVACWQDILSAGSAGGCVFSWQDEWHKRSWNNLFAVDFSRSPYWYDAQNSDQHFGLLCFDPGQTSACIVDGDPSEWSEDDILVRYADGSSLSAKYDEGYLYLYAHKPGFTLGSETLYIPIDTTQKTGATACDELGLSFDRAVDFLLCIHDEQDTVLMAQDRYHAIHANFEHEITGRDAYVSPPAKDSQRFEVVQLAVKDTVSQFVNVPATLDAFDTGVLRLGNADPQSPDYDSLTDFAVSNGHIEIRLPWALINFADPSRMQIHDDYYDGNYGVEFISIKRLHAGLGTAEQTIQTGSLSLRGWKNDVTWHERLKPAYYALQACWTGGDRQ